jgi:hypothetical protein
MPRLLTAAAGVVSLSLIACTGSVTPSYGAMACPEPCACPSGASGTRACLPDAVGYGLCEGCTATDAPWSKNFGAPALWGDGRVGAVAADDGVLAVTWVGSNLGAASQSRLRRFDPAGNALWDEGIDLVRDVAVDADGSVVVAFDIAGGASSILGMPVSCASDACAALARIGANGTPVWVQTLGADGGWAFVNIDTLRIAADGRIAVSGAFSGTLDLGNGPIAADVGQGQTIFVATLTADGVPVWSRAVHFYYPLDGTFGGWIYVDMAVSPAGDVLIAGASDAPLDYGAGMVQPASLHSSFFARYDPAGNVVHGGVLASDGTWPIAVAVDGAGNAVLAVWIRGTFDLGGGAMGTAGKDQLYLLKLDPTGHFLGGAPIAEGSAGDPSVAVDGAGHVWLCGSVRGSLTVGGAPVQPVSKSDVLLLELDPAGNLLSQRQFGTSGSSACGRIRIGPAGVPAISGWMDGSIDFGQGLLQAVGSFDMFVAKLGPGGL